MNKTVTVNIGGMVFHIEEHAYEKLKKYLDAIRGYFTTSEGRDEIIQDIESRIAEMFTERIGTSRQVVIESDVEQVIGVMGKPEQVAGEESGKSSANNTQDYPENETGFRKLYRDPDDKIIGGVCSGISHYIGIEPIWLRLIFGIALIFYGTGFLLYIILLIIIPKAKSTAEKLEMKGRPVNIDNIRKTIEEEVEDIKQRISNSNGHEKLRRSSSGISRFFDALGEILKGAFLLLGKIIAGFFTFILIIVLFALFVVILAMTGVIGGSTLPVFLSSFLLSDFQLSLAVIAGLLTIGVPLLFLLFYLVRLIFNIKSDNKILNYSGLALFLVGIVLSIWFVSLISREFRVKDQQRVVVPIAQPSGSTLYLDSFGDMEDDFSYDESGVVIDNIFSSTKNHDSVKVKRVNIDVVKSESDQFELIRIISGKGANRKDAEKNIRGLSTNVQQNDSLLQIDDKFFLTRESKFRAQKIQYILKVPVGKSVHFNHHSDDIIYDIKNVTNTYDHDMIDKTWTMTNDGLECLGCNLTKEENSDEDKNVVIRVNGKKIDIKKDQDTIDWNNKDVHININGNGVEIDAKEKNK